MTDSVQAFPLCWPDGWQRTPSYKRRPARYKLNFARARDEILESLRLMNVPGWRVIISTNVPTRRDGLPRAHEPEPQDPGVAVYWTTQKDERRVMACDAWRSVRENLRAIGIALEALRTLERTHATEILNRAFTGFTALPPASNGVPEWAKTLGLEWPTPLKERETLTVLIVALYKDLAFKHHPDRGGSSETMTKINTAYEQAQQWLTTL